MQRFKRLRRRVIGATGLLATVIVAACSGGGSTAPTPQPTSTGNGSGTDVPFNQRVNFTVVVPPPAVAAAAAKRRHPLASAAATNPYVSPNTASVSLQIGTVNGQSPRVQPAAVTVDTACTGTAGCSVPVQNVPAAKGVDRFAVQTFSGPGGTGNIISSGYIDVTVPSAQATSFGGTALSVGGYVQSISLALNIPNNTFLWHAPATGTLDVNALDPSGAIIIGNDQLANPIVVSLPSSDAGAFTISTAQQLTLQAPAQSVSLAYNGTVLLGGTVSATTTDENSQPVATSIPIPISPPSPTPAPKPTAPPSGQPTPKPLSLYVYDGSGDRILEYAGIIGMEQGQPLSATPRRVFELAPPPTISSNLANCTLQGFPLAADLAVSSIGTIYVQTICSDLATSTQQYVFTYSAATQEAVPAQATPTPPVPTSVFSVTTANAYVQPFGMALDEPHGTVFLNYSDANGSSNVIGVPMNTPSNPTTNLGATCLQELGRTTPCTTDYSAAYFYGSDSVAVDGNGDIYLPATYQASDANGNPVIPPGPVSDEFSDAPAILAYKPVAMNPAPAPFSALSGERDELGPTTPPTSVAVEGTTLYILAASGGGATDATGVSFNPGLSACPFPSANAPVDTPTSTTPSNCAGGGNNQYVAAIPNATQLLSSPASATTDIVSAPTAMLGGDVVGNFTTSGVGHYLAVRDGFVYVFNLNPPSNPSGSEIDVYNMNITGFHTDTAPVARLKFDNTLVPSAFTIGPTGTGVGGQAILRRPASVHHDLKAFARYMQQRRQTLRNRNNLR